MICASTSTSSAVVGSSATTKLGPQHQRQRDHDPLAHAAGELVRVLAVARRRDAHAAQRLQRAPPHLRLLSFGSWVLSVSSKCSEIRISGFSRVIGSWKIIAEVRPAHARAAPSAERQRGSVPWNSTSPSRGARPAAGPITPRPSVDLPQPDSPTKPEDLAGPDLEADAVDGPHRAARGAVPDPQVADGQHRCRRAHASLLRRWPLGGERRPARIVAPPQRRVEDVVQALADQRQPGHQQHDRQAREQRRPPDAGAGVGQRALEVVAPLGGLGGLDAEPEEAERGQGQDRVGGVQRGDHRHALHHVAEQVAADDRARPRAQRAGGLDVGLLAER